MGIRLINLLLLVTLIGCRDTEKEKVSCFLQGKTYLEITKSKNGYILFKPCDSDILKYKFGKKLYIGLSQDYIEYDEWQIKNFTEDSIYINVFSEPKWDEFLNFKLDTINHYLYNNGRVYIDSLFANEIPYIKEPCTNCWDLEDCESLSEKELEFFDASWKVNCNDTETQLVGLNPISEFYLDFLFQDQERARILVKVKKDLNEDEKYNLTYGMLTGITRTNRNLDWFDFSKDSIIGNISLINEKEFQFNWKGFYNNRTKRWESENFVFDNKYTKPLILKKCNN